ncbi:MAG: hypothetical protein RBR53_06890 [Desulforegulaceae bacterium]|nr:hypothetical protein [Desulforegulaceae bacterium]
MNLLKQIAVFSMFLFLCSCASKTPEKKIITQPAELFINEILSLNNSKFPSNGTGQLLVITNDKIQKYKIAFASDGQNSVRLEILSPLGLPALSIAYDGKKLYFRDNDGSNTKTFSNPSKVLKKTIGISPDLRIVSFLLTKKIFLIDFDNAFTNKISGETTLFLSSDRKKQSLTLKKDSLGFLSEVKTREDKFTIDFKENGNFILISEKTGNKVFYSSESISKIENEMLRNIFTLTR